jgi:drug/metabolite transporter (DMT)-like permease
MLLLGEAPSARQLTGVALVIGGIAAATVGGRRSAGDAGRSTGAG